ncbi:MAG: cbb3-type cytochrome oxidase assembly protein CcoS [Verrucomicrobia bacterium]|nr:MAG: cbb3-type cytochrome oxidase assembly protein CcoS [Verrucomicrobiota bacterium]
MPEWFLYFVALPMAMLIVLSAVYGLYWASRKGQLQDLDEGAKVIFDSAEPVGTPTDQIFHQPKSAKPARPTKN